MQLRIRLLIFCVITLLPLATLASLEDGINAYNNRDYNAALQEFQRLAKTGDAQAQLLLGLMYDNGLGTKQDYEQALHWYTEAAKRGHARAQFNVAEMLILGQGAAQNKQQAMEWYARAADNGFAEAQYKLGLALSRGTDIKQDLIEAYKWLEIATSQQVPGSEAALMALNELKLKMTPQQVLEAQQRSKQWQKSFAQQKRSTQREI